MSLINFSKSSLTMKALERSSILIAALFIALSAKGQVDRSNPPEAGPPPEINLGDPHSFELDNGLKVVVVEDHTVPELSFYLLLDHDPVLEGKKKGYVSMTGAMLDKGTKNRDRQKIAEQVDGMGASLETSGNSIYANSLRKHSGKLLDIMADVLMNPSFPKKELEKLKKQKKSNIQQEKSTPSAMRSNVRKAVTYGKDHPYGEVETKKSVKNVKGSDLRSHYKKYWRPNTSYLAVVGDVKPKKAEEMVRSHFSEWKKGEVPTHEYEDPKPPSKNKVAVVDKAGAVQTALSLTYPVNLEPGAKDVLPVKLMNSILGGGGFSSRLLKNIREDKGYTYGVFSNISTDRLIGSFRAGGSVATNVTDSALTQFFKEIKKLEKEGVKKEELKDHKDRMAGGFTLRLDNPQTIARYALNIDRYDLPKDYYKTYLKRLDKVSKKAVDQAAKEYLKPDNSHIVAVGDEDSLLGPLKKFGPVQRYDEYGFKKGKKKKVSLPEDLTAKKVLNKYVKAVGGKKAIDKIEDLRRIYKGSVRGRTLVMKRLYKHEEPGFFGKLFGNEPVTKTASELKIPNMMTLQKSVYDGKDAYSQTRGKVDTLTGEDLKAKKQQAVLVPQRNYLSNGYKVELLKAEKVRGKKAAVLKVTDPSGETSKEYYSLKSGLLLRTVSKAKGPRGKKRRSSMNYLDYEKFNGVKFPNVLKIKSQRTIKLSRDKIQINQGIADDKFKL
ncbi:MAG: M16 family metallopeptidase [Flavobacteriales bacterium]